MLAEQSIRKYQKSLAVVTLGRLSLSLYQKDNHLLNLMPPNDESDHEND